MNQMFSWLRFAKDLGVLLFVFSVTDAKSHSSCNVGKETVLASSCANSWGADGDWINLWNPAEELSNSNRVILTTGNCPKIRVLEIVETDHLAKITCDGASHELWVSLDWLKCQKENVIDQADSRGFKGGCDCWLNGSVKAVEDAAAAGSTIHRNVAEKMLSDARKIYERMSARAMEDHGAVLGAYENLTEGQKKTMFIRARDRLEILSERSQKVFGPDCDMTPKKFSLADTIRGKRTCRVLKAAHEEAVRRVGSGGLFVLDYGLAKTHVRMALFYGLSKDDQGKLIDSKKIALVREAVETPGAPYELHDGYIFGAKHSNRNDTGYDCSSFVASVLDEMGGQKTVLTTESFANIARHLADPKKNSLSPGNAASDFASCFTSVNLRAGEEPQPADLVVLRNDKVKPDGHVAVVESYDPSKGMVKVLGATGGKYGKIVSLERPLFELECTKRLNLVDTFQPPPALRSDVYVLRLKARNDKDCPINLEGLR